MEKRVFEYIMILNRKDAWHWTKAKSNVEQFNYLTQYTIRKEQSNETHAFKSR